MPMCMSCTAGNSGSEPAGHVAFPMPSGVEGPVVWRVVSSTQLGLRSRLMRSGMAALRYACLSPIDAELSIENKMSSLLTACSWTC